MYCFDRDLSCHKKITQRFIKNHLIWATDMLRKNFVVSTVLPFVSIGLVSNLILTYKELLY